MSQGSIYIWPSVAKYESIRITQKKRIKGIITIPYWDTFLIAYIPVFL